MSNILYEFVFVNLLLIANGIFAMSELAVVSSRKARLQQHKERGTPGAKAALELAANPNSFLSTVQIGITLVGILAGAFGGVGLTKYVADVFNDLPGLAAYSEQIAFFVVVSLITYLSLIIGELVPKRVALTNPERVACIVAGPMRFLSMVARPVVWLLDISSEIVIRLLRIKAGSEPAVTEEEIKFMVRQAAEAGVVEKAEHDIVHNLFHFTDKKVSRLMTGRTDVLWLDTTKASEHNWQIIASSPHSYFPVCEGSLDRIAGIVAVKHLWALEVARKPIEFKQVMTQPLYVPTAMTGLKLLETFKQSRNHFALVINEYGGILGVVTMNDVLEALVGDLPTHAETEEVMVRRDDGTWLIDGLVGVEKLKEVFKLPNLPSENTGTYETIGGFIMCQLGRIPHVADRIEFSGYRFEVVDMDGTRVDKVMVTRVT